MILIAAPDSASDSADAKVEVAPGTGPSVDSMALTKEGISSPAVEAGEVPASAGTFADTEADAIFDSGGESSTEAGEDEYRLADMPSDAPPARNEDWSRSLSDADATAGQSADWQPTQPLVPGEDWTSEGTTKTRQLLLIGTLAVAGIAFSIIGFLFFLQWYNDSGKTAVADGTGQLSSPVSGPGVSSPDVSDASGVGDAAGTVGDDQESAAEGNASNLDSTATPDTATSDTATPNKVFGNDSEQDGAIGDEVGPGSGEPALMDGFSDPPAANVSEENGTTVDAAVAPDAGVDGAAGAEEDAEEDRPLPKKLQFFAPMLDVALQPVVSDIPVVPGEAPVTAEELGIESESTREPVPAVDWETQSEVAVNGLIFQETPLFQMVNLLVHFTGVPTSVDFDSLAASGVDRNMLVTLQVTNAIPIGEVVKLAEGAVGLEIAPQENRFLRMQADGALLEERLPASISIDDLFSTEESQLWLQNTLQTLYPNVSDGFHVESGMISVDRQVVGWREWFETLRMLEGLRIESGMPTKLDGFQRTVIQPGFITASDSAALKQISAGSIPKAKPFGQLLSGIARSAGMHCWIDWPAVAELGVGPQTFAAVLTHDRTMRQVLSDCVSQFGLVVAVMDQESVWVTTPTAYRKYARLSVLPTAGRTVDQWRQYLRPLTPLDDQKVGRLVVIPTPDEAFVIVRSCLPSLSF